MTLVVNLFAGPGAGKSTLASALFANLKYRGVNAELASEFAKDLTWEGRKTALFCQPYVFGKQLFRVSRLETAGLDVIVTDSPLLLSCYYGINEPASFREFVVDMHSRFTNLNLFVKRIKTYDTRGRSQTKEEANRSDGDINTVLIEAGESFHVIPGDVRGAEMATRLVTDRLDTMQGVGG